MTGFSISRREFLQGAAAASAAGGWLGASAGALAASEERDFPRGKAQHCIFLWLGGGAAHMDTWDPKRQGDPKNKVAGSYYPAIDTAVPSVQVSQHLARTAKMLDRFALLRTVHHEVIDEHAAAVNRLHTGRPTSGTIVYPSIGSIVANQLGPGGDAVPKYVVIGYPNVTRGPGFLGARDSYIYLTDTTTGPSGLSRPTDIAEDRQSRRERMLGELRQGFLKDHEGDRRIADYDETLQQSLKLSGPQFASLFELSREPGSLRDGYGGEFGQRCLLARRLVQAGVRFVEVSHNLNFVNGTGWDVHNAGILNQHVLIEELDQALTSLVRDLERQKLLDKTLVVVATEFGRPAGFDGGGGRGHYSKCFSIVLAGGGLALGQAIGQTDELAMNIVERPVSVPDLHATMHAALGIDPSLELYAGERPVPITDLGVPVKELFA